MRQSWTNGLAPDAAKELRGDFFSSQVTRKRLAVLLEDKMKAAQDLSETKGGYDVPNWAYKQADNVGYQRALKEVIDLILE
jgi:hypothetical protein